MTRMDVTPQLIEQIDFSEKFRGYDPDQVDDFLERVGATLSELMIRERDAAERADGLEQEVRQLRERAAAQPSGAVASAPASSTPMLTDEQEIEQASRTLLMAKRTADATISEARQEAAEMLATARSQSEQLSSEAHSHRDDLLRRAREDAEREFGDQRNRFAQEIRDLDVRKRELADHIGVLEQRISEQRSDLERVLASLTAVVNDPGALRPRPPLDVDMTPSSTPPPIDVPSTGSPVEPAGEQQSASAFYAADSAASDDRYRADYISGDDVDVLDASDVIEREASAKQPTLSGEGSSDPWGPGSWTEVVSSTDSPDQFEPADPQAASGMHRVDEPTQAHTEVDGDRYLRDLDQAVNTDADEDALKEFFEGDDPTDGRRFGRRR